MNNKISDRSREFSQEALQRIEEIQSKYKSCPVYEKLTKEENDALLFKIIQLGNAVAATNYKKFSFYFYIFHSTPSYYKLILLDKLTYA